MTNSEDQVPPALAVSQSMSTIGTLEPTPRELLMGMNPFANTSRESLASICTVDSVNGPEAIRARRAAELAASASRGNTYLSNQQTVNPQQTPSPAQWFGASAPAPKARRVSQVPTPGQWLSNDPSTPNPPLAHSFPIEAPQVQRFDPSSPFPIFERSTPAPKRTRAHSEAFTSQTLRFGTNNEGNSIPPRPRQRAGTDPLLNFSLPPSTPSTPRPPNSLRRAFTNARAGLLRRLQLLRRPTSLSRPSSPSISRPSSPFPFSRTPRISAPSHSGRASVLENFEFTGTRHRHVVSLADAQAAQRGPNRRLEDLEAEGAYLRARNEDYDAAIAAVQAGERVDLLRPHAAYDDADDEKILYREGAEQTYGVEIPLQSELPAQPQTGVFIGRDIIGDEYRFVELADDQFDSGPEPGTRVIGGPREREAPSVDAFFEAKQVEEEDLRFTAFNRLSESEIRALQEKSPRKGSKDDEERGPTVPRRMLID